MRNNAQYAKKGYQETGLFLYRGTAALKRGRGMCFDLDYLTTDTGETAVDNFGGRGLVEVALPSQSNNMAFAGVLTQDYPANPGALVREVELALPGSCALIAGIIPTTINATRLTCIVPSALQAAQSVAKSIEHAGLWGQAGLKGRGTAIALKTNTNGTSLPWVQNLVGGASFATATGTITLTSGFTYAAAGDVVWVIAGGIANAALAGKYYIKTRTSADAAILALTPGGDAVLDITTNGGILAISVIPAAEPLTMAYLCDGDESGLSEYDVPVTGAVTNFMVGGWTNCIAGVTLAAAHTPPVVDGLFPGMRKTYKLWGALTTGYLIITPASLGIAPDGTIAVTATLAATLGQADLEWTGTKWDIQSVAVAATST